MKSEPIKIEIEKALADELARLRAENEQLEAERDEYRKLHLDALEAAAKAMNDERKARERIAKLEGALERVRSSLCRGVPDAYSEPIVDAAADACDTIITSALDAAGKGENHV